MNSLDHARLTDRFLEAVALDGVDRSGFLDRVRGAEPEIHALLRSLLGHDASPPEALRTGGRGPVAWSHLAPGARVGAYRVLDRIGEGGMGVVYLAQQEEPIRRLVALKLIRPGFESRAVMARFEAERRVLERMDHPNIARVLDAGTTDDLRRFVVMELVRGEAITRFADRHRLDVRARLRLFLPVCGAVHHAHQNAILHRDVKPTNVLVTLVDGVPVPKVIDFGIAKPLSRDPGAPQTLTEAGQMIGTPGYMSPEQALASADGVDIRSDVYSLGCLLFELLVGPPPFDTSGLRHLGWDELRELLLREDPQAPSACASGSDSASRAVAESRRTVPRRLARQLRGDIDGIVLKAIARKRDHRYESAHDLGSDVRRFLDDEPVQARPPSAAYRFRKFAARHRTGVAAVTAIVPLVLAFGVVMAVQAHRLARERDRAEEISEFLVGFYEVPRDVTAREFPHDPSDVLRNGLDKIRRHLQDRPTLAARLEHAVGESLRGTGDAADALPVLERAHARLAALMGAEDPRTLAARQDFAKALRDLRRYADAEAELRAVAASRERTLGRAHPDTLRTLVELGVLKKQTHRDLEAAEILSAARSGLIEALGIGHPEVAFATSLLGAVQLELGRLDEAETSIRQALASFDDGAEEKSIALYNLGCVHARRGERGPALACLRAAVDRGFLLSHYADPHLASLFHDPEFGTFARWARVHGKGEQERIATDAELAIRLGRHRDAEALYRRAIDALPPSPFNGFRHRLGDLYLLQGRYPEARPLVEDALATARAQAGPDRFQVGMRLLSLAQVHVGSGERAAALSALAEASRIFESDPGYGAPPWALYARAARLAIRGERRAALLALGASADAGFDDPDRLSRDVVFRSLRGAPEFRAIVKDLRRRYDFGLSDGTRVRSSIPAS